jgi:hypothetical protein
MVLEQVALYLLRSLMGAYAAICTLLRIRAAVRDNLASERRLEI